MQIKLQKVKNFGKLTQSSQFYPCKFALARKYDDHILQLHPWVLCRDYFVDALVWGHDPDRYRVPVYGFVPIPNINLNEVELLMKEAPCLKENFERLRELERELGISESVLEQHEDVFYIKGDPWWNKTTLHISAYTIILRTISCVSIPTWKAVEENIQWLIMRGKLKKMILALKKSGYNTLTPYSKDVNIFTLHGCSGMYTLIQYLEIRNTNIFGKEIQDVYYE
jgi:hypothetical protein